MGVVLEDDVFEFLMKQIDTDGGGSVHYSEFANQIKMDEVQRSMMPTEAPYGAVGVADSDYEGGRLAAAGGGKLKKKPLKVGVFEKATDGATALFRGYARSRARLLIDRHGLCLLHLP